ncbi:Exodeoxyribonuclease VII small subunit [Albimonas donghaensis]|uniref:Exodeoxyribonuclease 7 small subunit n=1 Tax=Albimonas donghaensis TaxID=356660 RepID=A0A1H2ZE75_9RHOB|nr:exodeoxyribonuclease VII small subunit [Albimonas donghaensis]MAS42132.1 exodeoxyribonuclease VII small subunit [Paracoccaceae bacterium]MBR25539.1 exodeoxyribonuclease VII small subunit [Paracoccaceae bacterium]SDX15792.1 Exodeoxyribonuclease VII small subunit [Albimonas donghaensis]
MTDAKSAPKPVETLSFEEAMRELEAVVDQLERGEAALEASITLYERGAKLKAHCEARLSEAQLKVDQIAGAGPDGPTAKPMDLG